MSFSTRYDHYYKNTDGPTRSVTGVSLAHLLGVHGHAHKVVVRLNYRKNKGQAHKVVVGANLHKE